MTTFNFKPRVGEQDYRSTALGASPAAKFKDTEKNKAVKLGANANYVPVTAGDELEAVVESLEPVTVNDGYSFGTISVGGRYEAKVDGASAVVAGDLVVAGAQAALGTTQKNVVVRKGTPTKFLWRVIDLQGGAGAVGSLVIIEKI